MWYNLVVVLPEPSLCWIAFLTVFLPLIPQVFLPYQPPLPWAPSLARRSWRLPPTPWAPQCPLLPALHSDTPSKSTLSSPPYIFSHLLRHHPARGWKPDRCHSASPRHIWSKSVLMRLTILLAGGCCCLRKKKVFPFLFPPRMNVLPWHLKRMVCVIEIYRYSFCFLTSCSEYKGLCLQLTSLRACVVHGWSPHAPCVF